MHEVPTDGNSIFEPLMLSRQAVAQLLGCSDRHVARLEKDGAIPEPVRLRHSVRYSRKRIEEWIDAGCPTLAV